MYLYLLQFPHVSIQLCLECVQLMFVSFVHQLCLHVAPFLVLLIDLSNMGA